MIVAQPEFDLDQARRTWVANLAALFSADPDLAAQLDAIPFAEVGDLEPARDGGFAITRPADDGRPLCLNSRYQPRKQAEDAVAAIGEPDNPTFFLLGLGLGYQAAEIERRFDKPVFMIAEDDLTLIKATLSVVDLSAPIRDGRVFFLTTADKAHFHERLSRCYADLMLGVAFITAPYTQRYHAAFFVESQKLLADFVSYAKMQLVTLLKTSRVTIQNVFTNLPHLIADDGVEALAGIAGGKPAFVVAAGPSLARHAARLREVQDHAVIICVQTVFKLLLSLGVRPHFVTSLDYHEASADFFEGVTDVGDCQLIAEPKATPRVLDLYPGRKRVLAHGALKRMLGSATPSRGALRAGSTVAHLSFYLAEHLGCDPIIFLGQDLCYADGLFYLPGTPIEDMWSPEMSRFQTIEMKQFERILRNRPILRRVRDVNDREVYTDEQLFSYAEQFHGDFQRSSRRVIHACESGMRIAGMDVMSFDEAVERFCKDPLPNGLFESGSGAAAEMASQSATAVAGALETRMRELREVSAIANEMRGLLQQLVERVDRPREFNRLIARVDDLRIRITRYNDLYHLVVEVSQMAELRRYSADRRIGAQSVETAETARRRLRRDIDFVTAFQDGCAFLERVFPVAIDRVRGLIP
ncbi:MAG: DUF115 domain-containing protein [Phycisphaerales bacterium]|nr:DUF115 domain-containing protein [Phycisphaerales bacterium]